MDRVLVTGAAGFIGTVLCERLREQGKEVWAIELPGRTPHHAHHCIYTDLALPESTEEVRVDVSAIYHLAGSASVPASVDNPRKDFENNVCATLNALEIARRCRTLCFVFVSSVSVLSPHNHLPLGEDADYGPVSPYGAAKMAGEAYCRAYHIAYGLGTRVVRLFNVYGPGRRGLVVFDLISKVLQQGAAITIRGDGTQLRDFLHVRDAVQGLEVVARAGGDGEIYHIASGIPVTVLELAESIGSCVGVGRMSLSSEGETWKGDIPRWYADIAKAKRIGFQPQVQLAEGLKQTIDWIRSLQGHGGEWNHAGSAASNPIRVDLRTKPEGKPSDEDS